MFDDLGGIKKYWHVIWLSREISQSQSLNRKIYGIPLLISRDLDDNIQGIINVCPHKKALLNFSPEQNTFVCTYHWWKFSPEWKLSDIPSSPHLVWKMKCNLNRISIKEQYGLVWVMLDEENKTQEQIINLDKKEEKNWRSYTSSMNFCTNEELLIENFMDATHTPVVHNKIIRDDTKKSTHTISVQNTDRWVIAIFGNTQENIAWFFQKIFSKKLEISHSDEFILPNMVLVKYYINGIYRFQAHIACSLIEEGNTQAFIRIEYNFWLLNFFLKLILPFIARRVLQQDFDITKSQYQNRKLFQEMNDNSIDYDYIHTQVHMIRSKVKSWWVPKKSDKIKIIKLNV